MSEGESSESACWQSLVEQRMFDKSACGARVRAKRDGVVILAGRVWKPFQGVTKGTL